MKSEKNTPECKDGVCSIVHRTQTQAAQPEDATQKSAVIELNADTFNTTIATAQKPVVIDFYATWCAPCKSIKPIFAQLAQEEDWVFCSLDVDQAQSIAMECNVTAMPTFVVFKNGIRWGAVKGALPKEQLRKELRTLIDASTPIAINNQELTQQLMMAIGKKSITDIKKLIAEGANLNETFPTAFGNFSFMQMAIASGNEEIIDLLLAGGSIIDSSVQETTEKYLGMLATILENYEENFNYINSKLSVTTPETSTNDAQLGQQFVMAIMNPSTLEEFLEQDVDINCTFMFGRFEVTPLYLALLLKNRTAIDKLIDAGASVSTLINDEDGSKKTVFEVAQAGIGRFKNEITNGKKRLHYALGKAGL